MEGPVPTAEFESAAAGNKKGSPLSPMGQELHSCDTTQIDAMRPLASRTIMRARWVTGRVPVGIYWVKDRSSRPQKSIQPPLPAVITPPTALLGAGETTYFSSSPV